MYACIGLSQGADAEILCLLIFLNNRTKSRNFANKFRDLAKKGVVIKNLYENEYNIPW